MSRVLGLLIGLTFAQAAFAQQQMAVVEESECEVVAKSGSAAGAVGGAAVGTIAGDIVGDLLCGKSCRGLGSLFGSGAGAAVGENIFANKTYRCVLTVATSDDKRIFVESIGKIRNVGQPVILIRKENGDFIVR